MYAQIIDQMVTNVVVCDDPAYAADQGWVDVDDGIAPQPGIGWRYDGKAWAAPTPAPDTGPQIPITVDPDALNDLVTQVSAISTVAQSKAALLAVLGALGADIP